MAWVPWQRCRSGRDMSRCHGEKGLYTVEKKRKNVFGFKHIVFRVSNWLLFSWYKNLTKYVRTCTKVKHPALFKHDYVTRTLAIQFMFIQHITIGIGIQTEPNLHVFEHQMPPFFQTPRFPPFCGPGRAHGGLRLLLEAAGKRCDLARLVCSVQTVGNMLFKSN